MNRKISFWIAMMAAPGPLAVSWLALPLMLKDKDVQVSLEVLRIATSAQSLVLVVIAAAVGALLSEKIGFRAPVASAFANGGGLVAALRPQILPGVAGGLIGAAVILCFYSLAPSELRTALERNYVPLLVRVLYGGITEEVLTRWGLMTMLIWTGWLVFQRGIGEPSAYVIAIGIVFSAILFGASHVPSVASSMGSISPSIIAYITIGNALFGVLAGVLFWRHGLETAFIAHVTSHVIAFLVRG